MAMPAASEVQVLVSREESGRVDTWTEHLCVRRIRPGRARLEISAHEILREYNEWDEDGNFIAPPSELDGGPVRLEHGYLVGERLVLMRDDSFFEYDIGTVGEALQWLQDNNFDVTVEVRYAILKALVELPDCHAGGNWPS